MRIRFFKVILLAIPVVALVAAVLITNAEVSRDLDGDGCENEMETAQNGRFIDESGDSTVCHDAATHTGAIIPSGIAEIKDASGNDIQRITNQGPSNVTYRFETADGTFREVIIPSETRALLETLSDKTEVKIKGGAIQPAICGLIGSVKCELHASSRIILPALNDKELHIDSGTVDLTIQKPEPTLSYYSVTLNAPSFAGVDYRSPTIIPGRIELNFSPSATIKLYLGGRSFDDMFEPEFGTIRASCTESSDPNGDKCFYERADHFIYGKGGVTKELASGGEESLFDPATGVVTLGPATGAGAATFASAKTTDQSGAVLADFKDRPNKLILAPVGRGEKLIFNGAECVRTLDDPSKLVVKRFVTKKGKTECARHSQQDLD